MNTTTHSSVSKSNKRLWIALAVACVLAFGLTGFFATLRFQKQEHVQRVEPLFTESGVLEIHHAGEVNTIHVYDSAGKLVAIADTHGQPAVEVRFSWQPGALYRVAPDKGPSVDAQAPEKISEFLVRLHAPVGQAAYEHTVCKPYFHVPSRDIVIPADPGETIDIMIEIEKLTDNEPVVFRVSTEPGSALLTGLRLQPVLKQDEARLEFEFDKKLWTTRVKLGDELPENALMINISSATTDFELSFKLRFVNRCLDENGLAVVRWSFPTDEYGFCSSQEAADQISMPNPVWNRTAAWFGVRPNTHNYFDPFTFQTLWIRNRTAHPVSLLVASEILDPATRKPVDFFLSLKAEIFGGDGQIRAFSHIDPGETQPCILPVYVKPETPAGTYIRKVNITLLGSDKVLKDLESPLGVTRSNVVFSSWVIGIAVLSLGWALTTGLLYRRTVKSFGLRVIVLLSLLGSLQFCLQFVGKLISNVMYAFLGPFNCLAGGLLTEVMTYLLVTSILFLVPRVGAMTLAGLVTYIMGGILFGSFGLTDILFTGSSIAFREVFLFIFGVTSIRPSGHTPPNLVAMMLALGLADATSVFTSLTLHSVFYRLFFADWYIFLQVVVTGFLYTALGVYLGKSLGMSLRKVHL